LSIAIAAAVTATRCGSCREPAKPQATGAQVHGLVYAEIADAGGTRQIFVPGVAVFLKDRAGAATPSKVTTNARGFFSIGPAAPGQYTVCWEADGFDPGCTPADQKLVIESATLTPAPIRLTPKPPIIAGRVALSNGAPCTHDDPMFGLHTETAITLLDGSGQTIGKPVPATTTGDFLFASAPPAAVRVRASCDGMAAEAPVQGAAPVRISIPNTAPHIVGISAGQGERVLQRAAPGATIAVHVEVADAGKQQLHYRWFPSDHDGRFVSRDAATVDWPLPQSAGAHTMHVLVQDERGSHSVGQVEVTTGGPAIVFSAIVTDTQGAPIGEATVSVNGQATTTNARGYFFLQLPQPSPRYLVNVAKSGYALWSKPTTKDFASGRMTLVKSQTSTADPTKAIAISQNVTGPGRAGAEIRLDANAVAGAGGPVPGPVSVSISTVDLHDQTGRLPGNFAGVDASRRSVRLTSYGGVDVQIRDAAGQPLNVAAGHTATVRIPIDASAEAAHAPPATVPLWVYDPVAGVWQQEGTAQRAGHFYEATVTHLSAFSVGLAATDAACMRLHFDPGGVTFPFVLNVTVPSALGADQLFAVPVPNAAQDVIAELPPNEPVTLQIGSIELTKQVINSGAATPGPANANPAPASCHSDAYLAVAPNDAVGFDVNNPLFSPGGFLNYFGLDDQVTADKYYEVIDPAAVAGAGTVTGAGAAITGAGTAFLTFFVPGDMIRAAGEARTIASITDDTHLTTFSAAGVTPPPIPAGSAYERVGEKTTLAKFKTVNGFHENDPDDSSASAVYFNAGDLGFGRSMHMWTSGGHIFYYVSNYANVEAARLNTGLIATVAMEYTPHPSGGGPYTKFYVFNGAGARVNRANLDGRGDKFVPRLCVVCHAGAYAPPTLANRADFGSRFIAFDLASYEYSGFDPAFSRASQEEAFRKLNRGVRENTNISIGRNELIDGWYGGAGGVAISGHTQTDNFVPAGWSTKATLYTDVVRPSCRTCHVNRDAPLDWAKYSGTSIFSNPAQSGFKENGPTIQPYLCGMRLMPHAKVPYISFWANSSPAASPNRLAELLVPGTLNQFVAPCPAQ
jgi:hypothetical protein